MYFYNATVSNTKLEINMEEAQEPQGIATHDIKSKGKQTRRTTH